MSCLTKGENAGAYHDSMRVTHQPETRPFYSPLRFGRAQVELSQRSAVHVPDLHWRHSRRRATRRVQTHLSRNVSGRVVPTQHDVSHVPRGAGRERFRRRLLTTPNVHHNKPVEHVEVRAAAALLLVHDPATHLVSEHIDSNNPW